MADFIMILGYLGWLRVLLLQTKKAAETFWQASLEKDSLVIQFFTAVLFSFILFFGKCGFPVICGMLTILFVHVTGFAVSLLVRPLYVVRYASPLLGAFAVTAAVAIAQCKERLRSRVSGCLIIVLIAGYIVGAAFECVEYETADDLIALKQTDASVWNVVNEKAGIPAWVQKWNGKKEFSFRSDFNEFGVWRLQ
jgi:hypothetical protein